MDEVNQYVMAAIGPMFVDDFDIVSISDQVVIWVPSFQGYMLFVNESDFWDIVSRNEVVHRA